MLPRQRASQVNYHEELKELRQDRRRFEMKLAKASNGRKLQDLVEKYRAYIKDLLLRPDSKAATLCNSLQPIVMHMTISKAYAFRKLTEVGITSIPTRPQQNRNFEFIGAVEKITETKRKLILMNAFRIILEKGKPTNQSLIVKGLLTKLNGIMIKQKKEAFVRLELPSSLYYLRRQLREKDNKIAQLQAQNSKLKEQATKSPNMSTVCEDNEQRIINLDRQLRQKQKDIKNLLKVNKDLETKYQLKVDKLQQQVNKINFINSKLLEQLEDLRQRRTDFSDIANQPDNSMSMQIFNQKEQEKDLEALLSEKYLRQVICLKQNIESIKSNFLALLQNNLKLQKNLLVNLMYLLNFNEEEKTIAKRNPLISQLMQ